MTEHEAGAWWIFARRRSAREVVRGGEGGAGGGGDGGLAYMTCVTAIEPEVNAKPLSVKGAGFS